MNLEECLEHVMFVSELNRTFFKEKQADIHPQDDYAFNTNIEYLVAYNHTRDLAKKWLSEFEVFDSETEVKILRKLFFEYSLHKGNDIHQEVLERMFDAIYMRDSLIVDPFFEYDDEDWMDDVLGVI